MPHTGDLIYRIDDRDLIVYVNTVWDEFAMANLGPDLLGSDVYGRPIWDFITDMTTRALYRDMLRRIRGGQSVHFNFRCDSPACRRVMTMDVSRTVGGKVEFRTRAVLEEPRDPVAALDPASPRSDALMVICSWCNRVDAAGTWLEVEDAVARMKLFEHAQLPLMTHGICDVCYEQMAATLSS